MPPVRQEAETTAGMYPMAGPKECPECGRDLRKRPRPEWVVVPGLPGEIAYGTNPVRGARWHAWDKTSPLRIKARPPTPAPARALIRYPVGRRPDGRCLRSSGDRAPLS